MLSRIFTLSRVARTSTPIFRPAIGLNQTQKRWGGGHGHGPAVPLDSAIHFLDREEVIRRVLKIVSSFDKVTKQVSSDSHFINDLGLDSLDVVEVVMSLEQEFNVDMSNQDAEKIQSVKDAIDYFCAHPASM